MAGVSAQENRFQRVSGVQHPVAKPCNVGGARDFRDDRSKVAHLGFVQHAALEHGSDHGFIDQHIILPSRPRR